MKCIKASAHPPLNKDNQAFANDVKKALEHILNLGLEKKRVLADGGGKKNDA